MRMISDIKRKLYFIKYNVKPFRAALVASHVKKRLLSALGIRCGFRLIDLAITYECNQKCEHCSAMIMKSQAPMMGLDDYRNIVSQAKKLDLLSWNITGGEPLLVPWLEDLIQILEPRTHYITVQTNCVLLDKKRAKGLSKLGVNSITTSIDSINENEHDEFRGMRDAYKRVFEGIDNARKAGMQVLIGGTVTHDNLRSQSLIELIEKSNSVGAIFLFNLAVPCGNWKGKEDVVLRGDDRDYLLKLMEKYPMTTTDHEVGRNAVGCPAGMEKLYITPYGDVIPCPFIHVSFGNILTMPLTDIVKRMRETKHFGNYQKICVAAEDRVFQRNIMTKIYASGQQCPVSYHKVYEDSKSG